MDAQVTLPAGGNAKARNTGYATQPPLQRFLTSCYEEFKTDRYRRGRRLHPGAAKANPAHFGIGLATIDGYVYEVGDSAVPFTSSRSPRPSCSRSRSKSLGEERVEAAIGVEPSGEAFNSIRLTDDNRPFNPMVNAGAIACSALIHQVDGAARSNASARTLSQFAGRELGVDEAVHASEVPPATAIARSPGCCAITRCCRATSTLCWSTYFRQCAVLVTARDLAVMAATLANRGINPVTGVQVITPHVGGPHAFGDDEFGHVRLCRRMDLSRRHARQERRRRRHRRGTSVATRARHLLAAARQPRQQRARPEGMRGAVGAVRSAHAQPERRRAHLHHRRLRHLRRFPPVAAGSRTSSRFSTSTTATSA